MKKSIAIILSLVLVVLVVVISIYFVDMKQMQKGEKVFFSTWGRKYAPIMKETKNSNNENRMENTKKIIYNQNGDYMEMLIPSDWMYEFETEASNYYTGGIKVYAENSENYATICFASMFGVCGTDLEIKKDTLNDGTEIVLGYYSGNQDWSYATFDKNDKKLVGWNYGLKGEDAAKVLEIIKTITLELPQE